MKNSVIDVTWSGTSPYTLTASYVASDAVNVDNANFITIHPYYAAGAAESGNTVDFVIEINPKDALTDPTGAFFSPFGEYTNSSGTLTERDNNHIIAQGVAGSFEPGVPVHLDYYSARQIRIKAKEVGVAANAGSLKMVITKAQLT